MSHGFLFLFSRFSALLRVIKLAKFMVSEFKWLHSKENDSTTSGNSRKFQCIHSISMRGDGCCFDICGKATHIHNGCKRANNKNWGECCCYFLACVHYAAMYRRSVEDPDFF